MFTRPAYTRSSLKETEVILLEYTEELRDFSGITADTMFPLMDVFTHVYKLKIINQSFRTEMRGNVVQPERREREVVCARGLSGLNH